MIYSSDLHPFWSLFSLKLNSRKLKRDFLIQNNLWTIYVSALKQYSKCNAGLKGVSLTNLRWKSIKHSYNDDQNNFNEVFLHCEVYSPVYIKTLFTF